MSNTTNLVLPYLAVGQAQKHVTVNESLRRLDALVQLTVISATTAAQPSSPADGAVYIVPAGKSGANWSAYANWSLGYYRDGAWEQLTPREGWLAYVKDADQLLCFDGAAWTGLSAAMRLSATDRILGRSTSGAGPAEEIAFTAQARALCDDASFAAMCATLGTWRVVDRVSVASSHTGSTAETALATLTLPGGSLGPNGALRITAVFSYSGTASAKTMRCRLGGSGLSGAQVANLASSSASSMLLQRMIQNRNVENAQIGPSATTGSSFGPSSNGIFTASVDTSVDQPIVFSGQLVTAAETIALESCLLEVAYGA